MIKRQSVRREIGKGTWYFYNDPPRSVGPSVWTFQNELITFDHPMFFRQSGGDNGGPFWCSKASWTSDGHNMVAQGLGRRYEGTIFLSSSRASSSGFTQCSAKPSNFDELVASGSTAIARTIPTNPVSGAAQFIGELHEGLPHFVGSGLLKETARILKKDGVKSRLRNRRYDAIAKDLHGLPQNAGSEYLNLVFGWQPMMSDLRKFARSVKETNKVLRRLDAGSGKRTRARFVFPTEKSSTVPDGPKWGFVAPFMADGGQIDAWMMGSGPEPTGYTLWSTTEVKTWFSGAYTYTIPSTPTGMLDKMERWESHANKLLGTRLTPEVVWELTPWSWAADWFSNMGDVIHNFSAFGSDCLTLDYGYIMRTSTQTNHSTWQGYLSQPDGSSRFVVIHEQDQQTQKVRLRATPFGFGLDMGSLSPRQMAIAGALGVSRAPRTSL